MQLKKLLSNDAFAVMRISNVRLFLTYRFVMTTATLMQSVVVGWQVYNLTKNVLSLGMIGLTEVIPQVCIALFAGHFVDIWDRRNIIKYTTLLLLLGSSILMVFSIPSLHCYELFGIFPIFITIFITGLVRGILMPAHTAFLGQIVPRELLPNAATWGSTCWQVAAVTGPAIGGLIYGFCGIVPAYALVFVFFLLSIILIMSIKNPPKAVIPQSEGGIFVRIREGIAFVMNNQILLGAFALDMFAVLFGGAVAMLPVFAADVLKVGPEGLGILRASPAIGAIIMSVFLTFHPPMKKTGHYLLYCVAAFGICMIIFALSKNFYLSAFVLLLSGSFDNMSVVIRQSILQIFTPDEMRGRVAAVNSIFVGSSNELGSFESGVAAKIMGLVPSVIFGGAMTLIVVATAARKAPILRKLSLKKTFEQQLNKAQ
ncbi:MAG: MFS transporter [Bacteroidota bacterium]|nr:MFS transporter [Bacteroidota bacterium]